MNPGVATSTAVTEKHGLDLLLVPGVGVEIGKRLLDLGRWRRRGWCCTAAARSKDDERGRALRDYFVAGGELGKCHGVH